MADPSGVPDLVLGIDYGTTYTSAGALVDGRVELVQDQGDVAMPSVVYVPRCGDPLVGQRAAARAVADPGATIGSIKRMIGLPATPEAIRRIGAVTPHPLKIVGGGVVVTTTNGELACEQLAASIFAHVRDLAERRFGGRAKRAVVTVPAAATPGYVAALRRAAKLAHLDVVEVVSEPIAGALALGLHGEPGRRRLVVCDFGGGTFDVTAIVQNGLKFSPIATYGEEFLGGDDLDAAMADALAGNVYRRTRFQILDDRVRRAQLLQRCESAKRALTTQQESRLTLRDAFVEQGQHRALDVLVDRAWIEPIGMSIIDRAVACVQTTLTRARWTAQDVDRVVLIGGSSSVPLFRRRLAEAVGADKVSTTPFANIAVAMGATLVTAKLVGTRVPQPALAEDDGIPIYVG